MDLHQGEADSVSPHVYVQTYKQSEFDSSLH